MAYEKQIWENRPSENTPISAARLAHLETQYDEAIADSKQYTDAELENLRVDFDLKRARISYGATFGVEDRFVMQGAFPVQAENNRWYTSRNTTGSVAGRETAVLSRLSPSGSGVEIMVFTDAGHGDSFFVEVENGVHYVWTNFPDWRVPTTDPGRYNFVRVPWSPGTYTYADVEQYRVPSVSGVNWRASYDEYAGVVAFRSGGGANRTMSAYLLSEVKDSPTLPAALASTVVPMLPEYGSVQDHAYLHEANRWFFLFGGATGQQAIVSYMPDGGVDTIKEINRSTDTDAWGRPFNMYEPEGLTVHHDPQGNPSLIFGVATGPVYARKSHVYSVDMGLKSSAFDLLSRHLPSDLSPWSRSAVTAAANLQPGFSESADRPFAVRISDGKVEFRGRVEGILDPAVNPDQFVISLNESFFPPVAQQAIAIVQGNGRVCRVEITTTGRVIVYLPPGDLVTKYSWVDFDVTNYWLTGI